MLTQANLLVCLLACLLASGLLGWVEQFNIPFAMHIPREAQKGPKANNQAT
jgi:hypothetical protein